MQKILLIEDDPLMIKLYGKIFKLQGFEVEVAERGADGLKRASELKPDLILLDVMMPEMDGFEVLRKLKSDDATKDLKVIILTNLAGAADAEKAKSEGASGYVIKSEHDPKEVAEIAKKVLSENSNNSESMIAG
jgi:Response regulator containing CheY-like receiver, AAA-type ATPase, and DNA-binding domains